MVTKVSGDTPVSQVQDGTILAEDFEASLFAALKSANGYQKLPSGLIIQWGVATTSAGSVTVTLPIPFPNGVFQAVGSSVGAAVIIAVPILNLATIEIYTHDHAGAAATVSVRWIAIGH